MTLGIALVRYAFPAAFLAMSVFGTGCTVGAEQMDAPQEDVDVPETIIFGANGNPETRNHLRPHVLMNHGVQQTVRDLRNVPLVNANNQLPSMPHMIATNATGNLAGGRVDFLEVLIGCALGPDQIVMDPAHTIFYVNQLPVKMPYVGEVGLAPAWTTRGLTTTEKEYVTACVLQRVNRYGHEIDILLEGNQTAITPNTTLLATYPGLESVAWGNMFDSTKPLSTISRVSPSSIPFDAYICHQEATCYTGIDGILRVCDTVDGCGFQYQGECMNFSFLCGYRALMGLPQTAQCAGYSRNIQVRLKEADMVCYPPPGPIDPGL